MSSFPSTHPFNHDKDFPYFRKPNIIGDFSIDGERIFCPDRSQLQLLKSVKGPVQFNLQAGFKDRKKKLMVSEGLDSMLKWILHNRSKFKTSEGNLSTDFICFRGLLRLILNTPYEQRDPWVMRITKWRGTIYILQVETETEKERKLNLTERDEQFQYWGYKFEQYMTRTKDVDSSSVNENEEFCCMFRSRIGEFSVMYGAEMDGYKSDSVEDIKELKPAGFVEFKTSRIIENHRQDKNFRKFKLIKWWAQSFLVGIEEIQCGWRDDKGIVSEVEHFPLNSIPKMAVDWKPNVCANFLLAFMFSLKQSIQTDTLDKSYRLSWDPRAGFKMEEEHNQTSFLPLWFTDHIFK